MPEERRRRAARTARRVADAWIGKQIFQSNQLPPDDCPYGCPLPRRRGDATDVIHFIINPTELRVAEVATRRNIFSRDAGARVVQPGAPPHTS